jgi:hypothetical protein
MVLVNATGGTVQSVPCNAAMFDLLFVQLEF